MWRRSRITTFIIVAILAGLGYVSWRLWPELSLAREWLWPAATVRIAVVGDNHGDTPIYRQILDEVAKENVVGLLNLADTSEHGTAEELQAVKAIEQKRSYPVWHVVGSHDIKTDPSRTILNQIFGGQPCQAINVQTFKIIMLDNADRTLGFSDQCLNWLAEELNHDPQRVTLIAYHRPFNLPLSALVGDDETSASRQTNKRFLDIVGQHKNVKLIMAAHLHTYLAYTLNGVPAVVSGGGGNPAQIVLGGEHNNFFHYLLVTVSGSKVKTEVRRIQLKD